MRHEILHAKLTELNRARLAPTEPRDDWRISLERELATVRERARQAPETADDFMLWFEELRVTGPGQGDPLFRGWRRWPTARS